jgi:hypothetical protein
MATVQYESKENAGHRFWTARYGRYAIRIDANRPGVYPWLITLERQLRPQAFGRVRGGYIARRREHPQIRTTDVRDG